MSNLRRILLIGSLSFIAAFAQSPPLGEYAFFGPMDDLAAGSTSEALRLLKKAFRERRGSEARCVAFIVQGSAPVSEPAWQFLCREVIPRVGCHRREHGRRDLEILLMWFDLGWLASDKPVPDSLRHLLIKPGAIEGFNVDQLHRPAERYVQDTLEDPGFYEWLARDKARGKRGPLKNKTYALAYAFWHIRTHLLVCQAFGTCAQVALLEERVRRIEDALTDSTVARGWDDISTFTGQFSGVVSDYWLVRENVLRAMHSRDSHLPGASKCAEDST